MAIKDDMEDVQEAVINELITENGITNTLADDQVTESKILNNAVTTNKIANGAVTASKLGSDVSLTVADGDITPDKLDRAYLESTGGTVTGNVGIGTTTVSDILHIAAADPAIRFEDTSSGITGHSRIFTDNNNAMTLDIDAGNNRGSSAAIFKVDGSERMRIDSSGNLLVGKTTTSIVNAGSALLADGRANMSADGQAALAIARKTNVGDMCNFYSDTTIVGTAGFVATGFYLQGEANHSGIRFGSGQLVPFRNGANADNSIDLGASSVRFDDIYATNPSIQTSDRNEKQDIEALSEAEQRVAVACKGLLRKFRWKSAVEEKGEEARIHFGIIAQDLQAAFEAEGLDAGRYAMFISSTWTDEETGEEKTRLGVRYSELLAFIISAI